MRYQALKKKTKAKGEKWRSPLEQSKDLTLPRLHQKQDKKRYRKRYEVKSLCLPKISDMEEPQWVHKSGVKADNCKSLLASIKLRIPAAKNKRY